MYNAVIKMQPLKPMGGYSPGGIAEFSLGDVLSIKKMTAVEVTPFFKAFMYASDCNRPCKVVIDLSSFPPIKRRDAFNRVFSLVSYTFNTMIKTGAYGHPLEIDDAFSISELIIRGCVEFDVIPMRTTVH